MKLAKSDLRALALLGAALLVVAIVELAMRERGQEAPDASTDSVATVQRRLVRVRQTAATLPAKEQALRVAADDLAQREKGIIQAETLPQAQAQLMQIMRRLASAQSPPMELRGLDMGQTRPLGDDYGEVPLQLSSECRIEQLVNLLADISAQPELLAVNGLRISTANQKEKTINVRLTLAGVVARRLVPEKKGAGTL